MKFMLLLLAVFSTISCSHDDCILEDDIYKSECGDSLSSKGEEDTRYYVKYEVYMPLLYKGNKSNNFCYRKGQSKFSYSKFNMGGYLWSFEKGYKTIFRSKS